MGVGACGIERDRPVEGGDGVVETAHLAQNMAAADMRLRIAGPEGDEPVMGGERFGVATEIREREAASVVRLW